MKDQHEASLKREKDHLRAMGEEKQYIGRGHHRRARMERFLHRNTAAARKKRKARRKLQKAGRRR